MATLVENVIAVGYYVNIVFTQVTTMSRDPQINVRLPQDLKDAVHEMAADNKRSVNAEIVAILLNAVRRHKGLANMDSPDGMLARAKEYLLPSEILEDLANRAAERALKLDREKK